MTKKITQKLLWLLFCVSAFIFSSVPTKAQKMPSSDGVNYGNVIVVRLQTNNRKINAIKQTINNNKNKDTKHLVAMLKKAIVEDSLYHEVIFSSFETFEAMPVYFIPDYKFSDFKNGAKEVFISKDKGLYELDTFPEKYLLFTTTGYKELFQLTDAYGNKLPEPYPHKKFNFLWSFQTLIAPEKLIASQISWFNNKLSKI